jgi:hypothetical protein
MLLASKCFGEAVGSHLSHRYMLNPNDLVLNRYTDEVVVEIDVVGTGVRYRVLCQSNYALAVREKVDWLVGFPVRTAEFDEQCSDPF